MVISKHDTTLLVLTWRLISVFLSRILFSSEPTSPSKHPLDLPSYTVLSVNCKKLFGLACQSRGAVRLNTKINLQFPKKRYVALTVMERRLGTEIISLIAASAKTRDCLLALTLTCKTFGAILEKKYLQFFHIRVIPDKAPELWEYLVKNPHLARNVRVLQLVAAEKSEGEHHEKYPNHPRYRPVRIPSLVAAVIKTKGTSPLHLESDTLQEGSPASDGEEKFQISRSVIQAIKNMDRIISFQWGGDYSSFGLESWIKLWEALQEWCPDLRHAELWDVGQFCYDGIINMYV